MLKKNKNILIIFSVGIVLIVSMFFVFNKKEEYKELPKVKLKEQNNNKKQFALMLEQTSGKGDYKESTDELPTIGYHFNKEKSGCTDINGKVIDDILDYDYDNYVVLLDTSKTSYCYLYYDKLTLGETIKNVNSRGLNSDLEGGLYRYQGVKGEVDNYICLNAECDSSNRYRIIGINEDNEIKLIKEESLGNITFGPSGNADTLWPDSNVYKALNTNDNSFYNTLSQDIKNMIVEKDWYYSIMNYTVFTNASKNLEQLYNIETGKIEMTYSVKVDASEEGNNGVSCQTITQENEHKNEHVCYINKTEFAKSQKSNIAVMYIHDYYYSLQKGGINCQTYSDTDSLCINSWLNNNNVTESLISHRGFSPDNGFYTNYSIFGSNSSYTTGSVGSAKLNVSFNYRPVFYINKDLSVIKGNGTAEEPFIIKKIN